MRSCILCVHIETSSLWAEFVNKNRCISVRLVSEEVKALNFDNSHNSFLWPEYFIDFLCERWIPCQALTSVLCLHYRPETVHCSTKDVYTSEKNLPCITSLQIVRHQCTSFCLHRRDATLTILYNALCRRNLTIYF